MFEKQSKREWTPAEEARYWASQRRAYVEKNERLFMEPGYYACQPRKFYRWLFGDGFLEAPGEQLDWDEPGGGRPNAIAVVISHETRARRTRSGREVEVPVVRRHSFHDGFDDLGALVSESLELNETAIMSPVSYFGRRRDARHARYLHALAFDLDGVGREQLGNLLKQIGNGRDPEMPRWTSMPQPSAIVNSGTGLHLYYVLERPVPLLPKVVPFLQELKRQLTDVIWTEYTSTIPLEQRQYQGIYQGFRMVGTTTKLNGRGEGSKRSDPYEAVAFRYEPEYGSPWRVSLDYLLSYASLDRGGGREGLDLLRELWETGGRTPLERAMRLWPYWYERRVVNGAPEGRWTAKRALYDWWLAQVREGATYHHRYFCVRALATYADKAGVPFEELERDAYSLVPSLDGLTEDPSNHFTDSDVAAALERYHDGAAHRETRARIERETAIRIEPSVPRRPDGERLKQKDHLEIARAVRDVRQKQKGTEWGNKDGAPTKADLVRSYAAGHPGESHSAVARALGVSRPTVIKWLRPGWREEWEVSRRASLKAGDDRFGTLEEHRVGQPYPNGHGGFSVELHDLLLADPLGLVPSRLTASPGADDVDGKGLD